MDEIEIRRQRASYMRAWSAANREKVRESQRRKYLKYRDRILAQVKERTEKNKDRIRAYYSAWRKTPEGIAARTNAEYRRRALKRNCASPATNVEIKQLLSEATNCEYCKVPFGDNIRPTLDHVVPLSRGGSHSGDNLVAACLSCNTSKGARLDYQGST